MDIDTACEVIRYLENELDRMRTRIVNATAVEMVLLARIQELETMCLKNLNCFPTNGKVRPTP